MAGTFTHYMICDKAITSIQNIEIDEGVRSTDSLGYILGEYRHCAILGCGSPDIPYVGSSEWAKKMHYSETNGIVNAGINRLRLSQGLKDDVTRAQFAWLMGYLSHIIADTIVHPVVKLIVGGYEGHEHDHRVCEMVQDSILYKQCMGDDISYSEFHAFLKQCKETHYDEIMNFWKELAEETYPKDKYPELDTPKPTLWATLYLEAMDTIEGGNTMLALFRHIEVAIGHAYAYRTVAELEEHHADWVNKYYSEVPVPNETEMKVFDFVFEAAVRKCVNIWKIAHSGILGGGDIAEIVPCMDLDEGTVIGTSSNFLPMWEA